MLLFTIELPDKRRRSFALIVIKYLEDNTKLFAIFWGKLLVFSEQRFMNSFVKCKILDFHGE